MTDRHQLFSGEDTPDCPHEKCAEMHAQIAKVCKSNGWPANYKVLVCDVDTGQCCYCHCA